MSEEIVIKYYIGSEQECLDYNEAVKNYQGTTTDWALPQKHPEQNLYAILAEPTVTSELEGVGELSNDWVVIPE